MNKLSTQVKTFSSCLLFLSVAMTAPTVWAHKDCTPYTAVLHLEGITPFGPLNGGGIYTIGDLPPQQGQVSVVLKGSATFDPTSPVFQANYADMVLFAPSADGSLNILTAIDKSVGAATGPGTFEATTRSRITGGVGMFEGVRGKAFSTNVTSVDLTTGYTISDINVRGKICGIGEAGHSSDD
ncbi:hypothetical protein MNBD_GAMMA05-1694 [hydrothermal vent metagenome]|uniref:Dirigent protein n=1 Tax=hydrothermal vent metagenome TaxID=652676 RepID=A0A3B0WV13_9ZZZZ